MKCNIKGCGKIDGGFEVRSLGTTKSGTCTRIEAKLKEITA